MRHGLIVLGILVALASISPVAMAQNLTAAVATHPICYVTIAQGQKLWPEEDSGKTPKRTFAAFEFSLGILNPHDLATGRSLGKEQEAPLTVTRSFGLASVALFNAMHSNALLNVVVDFYLQNKKVPDYTIKLTDATISGIQQYSEGSRLMEKLSFTYREIEVNEGKSALKVTPTASSSVDWNLTKMAP